MKAALARKLQADPITPERRTHDTVRRDKHQVVDAAGHIGNPWRVDSMLGKLEAGGSISAAQRSAGEQFQRLFRLAALDPLHAGRFDERALGTGRGRENHTSEWAKAKVNRALDALGGLHSPCGSCAWFVLGLELSVSEWGRREGWSSRPLNPHVAKGTLIGCLGVLEKHLGV